MDPDLGVQGRAGAVPRRTDVAKDIPTAHVLSLSHREAGKMSVNGRNTMAVVDHHLASITVRHASLKDGTVRRRSNRLALGCGDVNSGMKRAFPVEGIQPGAEGTGYDTLHRPFRWRGSHIHDAAESRREMTREVEPVSNIARHGRGTQLQKLIQRLTVLLLADAVAGRRASCRRRAPHRGLDQLVLPQPIKGAYFAGQRAQRRGLNIL